MGIFTHVDIFFFDNFLIDYGILERSIEMQKVKFYKCPHCGEKYQSLQTWGNHVAAKHPGMIPEGWSYGRYFYMIKWIAKK